MDHATNNVRYDWAALGREVDSRLNYGDSARVIAESIGMNHVTFLRARKGLPLKIENAIRICRWLGKDLNDFILEGSDAS